MAIHDFIMAAAAGAFAFDGNVANVEYNPPANSLWDIGTTTENGSQDFTSYSGISYIAFSDIGDKLFICNVSDTKIYEISLAKEWVIESGRSVTASLSISSQTGSNPRGIFFKPDGTKLYVTSNTNDRVYQYSLSSSYDLSTATYDSKSVLVSAKETDIKSVFFKTNGTEMYIVGNSSDSVHQYTLSTAWDVSTATFTRSFSVASQTTTPSALFFRNNGTTMYVGGQYYVYQYTLSTPWDISTASFTKDRELAVASPGNDINSIFISDTGDYLFYSNENGPLGTTEISKFTFGSFRVSDKDLTPTGVFFKPDGMKMYFSGSTGDKVYQYDLSTKWDLSTAVFYGEFSVSGQDTVVNDLYFKYDGLSMFIIGSANDRVVEYTLSTAWDVTTATFTRNRSVSSVATFPQALFFRPDGTRMYVLEDSDTTSSVLQFILSTPWDISTATYGGVSFSVGAKTVNPRGLFFSPTGNFMYVVGSQQIFQYSMSSTWDISTLSFTRSFDGGEYFWIAPTGLFFDSTGKKLFLMDSTKRAVVPLAIN